MLSILGRAGSSHEWAKQAPAGIETVSRFCGETWEKCHLTLDRLGVLTIALVYNNNNNNVYVTTQGRSWLPTSSRRGYLHLSFYLPPTHVYSTTSHYQVRSFVAPKTGDGSAIFSYMSAVNHIAFDLAEVTLTKRSTLKVGVAEFMADVRSPGHDFSVRRCLLTS